MSGILPNCFQSPNDHVDRAMHLLTPEEFVVLSYATRHILGWQDKIDDREGHISLSMFEDGFTTKRGVYFAGCGLRRPAIVKALEPLTTYRLLEKVGDPTMKGQKWHIGENVDWQGLEDRASEKRAKSKKRTAAATQAKKEQLVSGGGTSDEPVEVVRPTNQSWYVPRTQTKPLQKPVIESARKQYPCFYTVGMKYKDKVSVEPYKFTHEVNALFYAYLDVLEQVNHGAAAMTDYLWEKYREECKALALARVLPEQLKGYVLSKYDPNVKGNDFWINRDEGVPLSNVVKSITGWIAKQNRRIAAVAPSGEAQVLADREARKAAAMAEEQELARLGRGELSA